jgi:hypothetical protein
MLCQRLEQEHRHNLPTVGARALALQGTAPKARYSNLSWRVRRGWMPNFSHNGARLLFPALVRPTYQPYGVLTVACRCRPVKKVVFRRKQSSQGCILLSRIYLRPERMRLAVSGRQPVQNLPKLSCVALHGGVFGTISWNACHEEVSDLASGLPSLRDPCMQLTNLRRWHELMAWAAATVTLHQSVRSRGPKRTEPGERCDSWG